MAWDGKERRKAPITPRTTLILFIVACVYMTVVFAAGEIRNRYWANERDAEKAQIAYENQLDSCDRGLKIRKELNKRKDFHENDAKNLRDLSKALADTRQLEARVFRQLGQKFGIPEDLQPLVNRLESAAKIDRQIQSRQGEIRFSVFGTPPCSSTVEKP